MKKSNLNSMGVQELSTLEMQEATAGFFWVLGLFVGYIVVEACCNPDAHIKAFKEGWQMAEK